MLPSSGEPQGSNEIPSTSNSDPVKAEEVGTEGDGENAHVKVEKPSDTPSAEADPSQKPPHFTFTNTNRSPIPLSSHLQSKLESDEKRIKEPAPSIPSPVEMKKIENEADNKMDIVVSPKAVLANALAPPNVKMRSPSPKPPPSTNDHHRGALNVPQRSWPGRSPPRAPRSPPKAPRNHRLLTTPQTQTPPYPNGPRENRRPHPLHAFSDVRLPSIPKYFPPKFLSELDQEISKHETLRRTFANQHLQEVKGLQKALHELDMVSIDLHAAEGRHRIADFQLDKAKTGSLGIDALNVVEI
ncbi:hypothetical protein GALMADRAFT_134894 [Galerina marginata CBS 339.88]|uniref:Uncharacterized protein n=1 Tax=Galerina marginata (strain CBS 339.88) TaxID=685588 RepID=A0A067TE48_GALM3|nr:hypothetical protein GALMADRAFT_134894 [Galerina marginata CBS 339.88]